MTLLPWILPVLTLELPETLCQGVLGFELDALEPVLATISS